jgi:hypothetical protein
LSTRRKKPSLKRLLTGIISLTGVKKKREEEKSMKMKIGILFPMKSARY